MRRAVFLRPAQRQHSDLAEQLGCALTEEGFVQVDEDGRTSVPGIYAAGDLMRRMQQIVLAAADGARAAFSINGDLLVADLD